MSPSDRARPGSAGASAQRGTPTGTAAGTPTAAPSTARVWFHDAYLAELRALRPHVAAFERTAPFGAPPGSDAVNGPAHAERLAELFETVGSALGPGGTVRSAARGGATPGADLTPPAASEGEPLSALCFSGGGIRSATFNLGVLQALAAHGALTRFDYLSTVSGGGYIGGWVQAWLARERRSHANGTARVLAGLAGRPVPPPVPHATPRDDDGSATSITAERSAETGDPENAVVTPVDDDADGDDGRSSPAMRLRLDPLAPEPRAVDQLREYSNYLTPRLGLFSPDTWAAASIVVRNVLLNWLVVLPALAALLCIPQVALLIVQGRAAEALGAADGMSSPLTGPTFARLLTVVSVALGAWSSWHVHRFRLWSLRDERSADGSTPRRATAEQVRAHGILPVLGAALALCTAALWAEGMWSGPHIHWGHLLATTAVWCLGLPLVGWLPFHMRERRVGEGIAIVVSGLVSGAGLVGLALVARAQLVERPALYVALSVPLVLADYLLARVLFVAVASTVEDRKLARALRIGHDAAPPATVRQRADHDREWWARFTGGVLLGAVAWLGVGLFVLLGDWALLHWLPEWGGRLLAGIGGVSGLAAALLGKSGETGSGRAGEGQQRGTRLQRFALAAAAPTFAAVVLLGLGLGTARLGRLVTGEPRLLCLTPTLRATGPCTTGGTLSNTRAEYGWFHFDPRDGGPVAPRSIVAVPLFVHFLLVPVGLALVAGLASGVVNPNRFSLHGFYRNRLVRAYLGASNTERRPDPFTGFDPSDDVKLHELWPSAAERTRRSLDDRRPMALVNVALNLTSGQRLAWQQRKAESFAMTPLYCRNFYAGYRRSDVYGAPGGLGLGTAVTISGAAASPNMGYHSSPAVSFVMTLFNARLGAWLANPGPQGDAVICHPGPRGALRPLLAELTGGANAASAWVNLSDGGHFENLALYEVVLRRCRHVVVCDAGCDPDAGFEDLGNAVRKIRIDFGIPIELDEPFAVRAAGRDDGLACALGWIRYDAVDGPDAPPGRLVYLKPQLRAATPGELALPLDVRAYANGSRPFPHEPTSDQWFDESQFESYRALGRRTLEQILAHGTTAGVAPTPAGVVRAAEAYVARWGHRFGAAEAAVAAATASVAASAAAAEAAVATVAAVTERPA